jgi:hypothetical protein
VCARDIFCTLSWGFLRDPPDRETFENFFGSLFFFFFFASLVRELAGTGRV